MEPYRVLCLDGGGIRGVVTAVLLERLLREFPDLLSRTRLLAGTSSGGILALALAHGRHPSEMRRLYQEHSSQIFHRRSIDEAPDLVRQAGAVYDNRVLRRALKHQLGEATRLRDLGTDVLVPAFELDNRHADPVRRIWRPRLFHTLEAEAGEADRLAWQVALYTSAAPGYFPSADGFVDGGMFAPNPAMLAAGQALQQLPERSVERLRLLSVGTGLTPRFVSGGRRDWPLAEWVQAGLLELMLDGMAAATDLQARALMDGNYHRLNPTLPPGEPFSMDALGKIDELRECAEAADLEPTLEWLARCWR